MIPKRSAVGNMNKEEFNELRKQHEELRKREEAMYQIIKNFKQQTKTT